MWLRSPSEFEKEKFLSILKMNEKLNKWKKRLDSLTDLVLPTDYPRSIPPRVVEADFVTNIKKETSLAIMKLSLCTNDEGATLTETGIEEDISPFSILLAAFVILLHKYTGEEDITVGSSSTNLNPLVLRNNITKNDTVKSVIQRIINNEKNASIDEIPFDLLLNEFKGPLFKVRFFNLNDTTPEMNIETSSSCDMTIFISQTTTARRILPIQLKIIYNSVLFSEARISDMVQQLELVICQGAEAPDTLIEKLSIVTKDAKLVLPDPISDLKWDNYQGSITDIFTKNSNLHPDRVCVLESASDVKDTRYFTYQQMNHASNILAHHLIQSGIKREDVVVLYSYRGVDLVVAIIGVLKSGATFSVIDPAYPPSRQNIYLQVSQPKGLVVLKKAGELDQQVRDYIQNELEIIVQVPALEIDSNGKLNGGLVNGVDVLESCQELKSVHPNIVLGPDSIGTLSFTSGSTGIPKGVRGRHFSLTHFYPWMMQEFGLCENDRFTMLSGIAHDPIQRDIFTPLFMGAQICIPTFDDIMIPGQLAEWMSKVKITITHLTPAMGQLLSANATTPIPTLRHAFFVGDVLTKRDVVRLQHLAENTHVINMYGTTETQRAVSYLKIPPIKINRGYLSEQKDIMPAGKGMKNVQLLIMNSSGLLAGIGEIGEIFVRSSGLAEGYLRLPEVTAEKFIPNPFTLANPKNPNDKQMPYYLGARDRMYRTGDLGRYLPDGNVECTGRADDQVKIRGFRIELKEIDTHMSQHSNVRENVTLVKRDKDEEKTLVTYFVPLQNTSNIQDLIKDIREYLKQKLPSYAIPSGMFYYSL
jgi:L-aminoadipate-semialdehyde dehydrogenase